MRVLLFDVFKPLLLKKTDILKTCCKSKFLERKIWRNELALKSKKVQGIFKKTFFWALLSSAVFHLQTVSQIYFKLFCLAEMVLIKPIFEMGCLIIVFD